MKKTASVFNECMSDIKELNGDLILEMRVLDGYVQKSRQITLESDHTLVAQLRCFFSILKFYSI